MGKIIYEHLGYPINDETFKLERNIELRYINKPRGGLLASRYNNKTKNYFSWADWVKCNEYNDDFYLDKNNRHLFILKPDAKILTLSGENIKLPHNDTRSIFGYSNEKELKRIMNNLTKDRNAFLKNKEHEIDRFEFYSLDWDYIFSTYDGIELIHGTVYSTLHFTSFNSWDCDSICIWNKDVVTILNEGGINNV